MNSETFSLIYILKTELKQKIAQKNYYQISKQLRHFVSLCNSVAIRLLHSGAYTEVVYVLKKSSKGDEWLCKYGSQVDQLWQGRLVYFIIQTYFLLLTQELLQATKVLYKAHTLIEDIKDKGGILNIDIRLVLNFISFLVLWKSERLKNCENFLEVTKKALETSKIIRKICRLKTEELEILLAMASAAFKVKTEGNFRQATKIIVEVYERHKNKGLTCYKILQKFWNSINDECNKSYQSEYNTKDFLITPEFEEALIEVCILPFMSEDCPIVLPEKSSENMSRNRGSRRVLSFSDKNSTNSSSFSRGEPEIRTPKTPLDVQNRKFKVAKGYSGVKKIDHRLAIYSPTIGVVRSRSTMRARKVIGSSRPQSQGRFNR